MNAALAAAGLAASLCLIAAVSYVADNPQGAVELGFVAPDIEGPDQFGSKSVFRADVAVDVEMNPSLWPPWNVVKAARSLACQQPASVIAVFSGTQPMWREALSGGLNRVHRRGTTDQSRVGVAVTAPVDDFVLRAAEGNLGPLAPRSEADTRPREHEGLLVFEGSKDVRDAKSEGRPGKPARLYNIRTGTMRRWDRHLAHVVAKFEAPWTSFRSFGSCYVRLPRLLRTTAEREALFVAARDPERFAGSGVPNVPNATAGLTRLNTDGAVDADSSEPRPTAAGGVEGLEEVNDATWSCNMRNGVLELGTVNALGFEHSTALRLGKSGVSQSTADLPTFVAPETLFGALERSRSCQAVAVISAPQAAWIQVLVVLLVGAALAPLCRMLWLSGRPAVRWLRSRQRGERR